MSLETESFPFGGQNQSIHTSEPSSPTTEEIDTLAASINTLSQNLLQLEDLQQQMNGALQSTTAPVQNEQSITEVDLQEANDLLAAQIFDPPHASLDDLDDVMAPLEDAPPIWQPAHQSNSTDVAVWASANDPPPLHPLHPVLSSTSLPDINTTAVGLDATSTEAWDEEALFTLVGDVELGETLPNSTDLFGAHLIPSIEHHSQDPQLTASPPIDYMFAFWRRMWKTRRRGYPFISTHAPDIMFWPDIKSIRDRSRSVKITPKELPRFDGDIQGIEWNRYSVTKAQARDVRRMTYWNYTNTDHHAVHNHDMGTPEFKVIFPTEEIPALPNIDHHFSFRATHTRYSPLWRHYQLRHNMFAASQNAIFYHTSISHSPFNDPIHNFFTKQWTVACYNPNTCTRTNIMDFKSPPAGASSKLDNVSTLSANHDVLVVGSTSGVYGLRSILTPPDSPYTVGQITPGSDNFGDNSTNHVYTHLSRSSNSPHAAFSSNDFYVRTLDIATNTWLSKHLFNAPVNCAASSPDTRLRLLVSDDNFPIIADAETGEKYHSLPGHEDHGFACAWAPDGYTLATAHQDGMTQIYDARNPSSVLAKIPCEQACVRSLQFSPLGSGPPVLVAAEPADFVHVIDADTFASKQTIEFFGDIAGASITPDGETLWIGCADPGWGGFMEFERQGYGVASDQPERVRKCRDDAEFSSRKPWRPRSSIAGREDWDWEEGWEGWSDDDEDGARIDAASRKSSWGHSDIVTGLFGDQSPTTHPISFAQPTPQLSQRDRQDQLRNRRLSLLDTTHANRAATLKRSLSSRWEDITPRWASDDDDDEQRLREQEARWNEEDRLREEGRWGEGEESGGGSGAWYGVGEAQREGDFIPLSEIEPGIWTLRKRRQGLRGILGGLVF